MIRLRSLLPNSQLVIVATVMIIALQPRSTTAQNLSFMPGDAFFAFSLTEDTATELAEDADHVVLQYATPLCNFGGYAGFSALKIEGTQAQFVRDLQRVYRKHRTLVRKIIAIEQLDDGTRHEAEMNAPLALVYNRDVDWTKQRMALKYNEDWPCLPDTAYVGAGRNLDGDLFSRAEVYQPLMCSFDSVVEDWRNAKRYRALDARVPKGVAWGKAHRPIEEPIIVDADRVQIIVLTSEIIHDFFSREDVSFYQVTTTGTHICRWNAEDGHITLIKDRL